MDKTKSSSNTLALDYGASQGITTCFLKDTYNGIKESNADIIKDIEAKDAFPAQLEDYAYNNKMLNCIEEILTYFGEQVE